MKHLYKCMENLKEFPLEKSALFGLVEPNLGIYWQTPRPQVAVNWEGILGKVKSEEQLRHLVRKSRLMMTLEPWVCFLFCLGAPISRVVRVKYQENPNH